ncbi:hypothetical protein NDU88_005478 [Pleurodeles waltl]|uniref:Uncharacterized protein n=1 Tax=Pleurodeles waltl TaxID=8319 RepID=A0AAV7RP66_PLEWA|nr:hypothetical protein NDU88_005478 [Pleurodeles waltl]
MSVGVSTMKFDSPPCPGSHGGRDIVQGSSALRRPDTALQRLRVSVSVLSGGRGELATATLTRPPCSPSLSSSALPVFYRSTVLISHLCLSQ